MSIFNTGNDVGVVTERLSPYNGADLNICNISDNGKGLIKTFIKNKPEALILFKGYGEGGKRGGGKGGEIQCNFIRLN